MAYPKRVYTDGVEEVSYVDMNRIETGIETNDLAIAKINADNIARDKEISTKETITGAQEKANVTLKSAKEYADGKVKLNGSTTNVNFISEDGVISKIKSGNVYIPLKGEKGDVGEKGSPGTASVAMNDEVINFEQTWTSGKIISKLANKEETKRKTFYNKVTQNNVAKGILCFIDDDGRTDVYTKLKPFCETNGIPITSALITDKIGQTVGAGTAGEYTLLTETQILEMNQSPLFDFCSHTATHVRLADETTENKHIELKNSHEKLKELGLLDDIIVYPYGSVDAETRLLAKEFYKFGVYIDNGQHLVNYPPIASYHLERVYLEGRVEICKQKIDEAVLNNGLIIIGMHCWQDTWNTTEFQEVVDYAKASGIEITTLKEALYKYANLLEIGDSKDVTAIRSFAIGWDGKTKGNDIGKIVYRVNNKFGFSILPASLITDFEPQKITVTHIAYADRTGWPENSAGELWTYNLFTQSGNTYSRQEYYPLRLNMKFERYWDTTNSSWGAWARTGSHSILLANTFTSIDLITSYPKGITTMLVDSNNGDSSSFPSTAGIVNTYRINGSGYDYQEFVKYNSRDRYTRKVLSSGAWDAWIKDNIIEKKFIAMEELTINANYCLVVEKDLADVTPSTSILQITPSGHTSGYLIYRCSVETNGKIKISIMNTSSEAKTITARNWIVSVIY